MSEYWVVFTLWLFFGIFGVHHIYLKRDRHAFLWLSSFGGWGIGWLRDWGYLEEYIEIASGRPVGRHLGYSSSRQIAMFVFGAYFGFLYRVAIPEWAPTPWIYLKYLSPLAVAFGVHTVANLDPFRPVSFLYCLGGALAPFVFAWKATLDNMMALSSIVSCVVANYQSRPPLTRPEPSDALLCHRLTALTAGCCVVGLLWISCLGCNVKLNINGEEVPLHEAFEWKQIPTYMYDLYFYFTRHGFSGFWNQISDKEGHSGVGDALGLLELHSSASDEEIEKQCRGKSKQWHPDRHRSEEDKLFAQSKFIDVQKACDILLLKRRKTFRPSE